MKPRISNALLSFSFASAALLAAPTASAVVWDSGNNNGNWASGANWATNSVPGAGSLIEFNSTSGNVTAIYIAAARTVGGISFLSGNSASQNIKLSTLPNNGTAVDLTFSSTNTGITVDDGFSHTIGNPSGTGGTVGNIVLAGNLAVATTSGNLTINQPIDGSTFGVSKSGVGTLVLSGTNLYSGATSVSGGVLAITNYAGLGNTSDITVSGGTSVLEFRVVGTGATSDTINKALSLNGTLRTAGGTSSNTLALTWDGNITLGGNSTINNHGNGSIDVNGQVDLAANTLTFQADQTGSRIDGNIIGSGGLTKTGVQTLTITGANTFTGATNISTGTLSLGNVNALGGPTPGVNGTSGITIGGVSAATLFTSTTGITIAAPITTANTGVTSTIAFGRSTSATGSITLNGAIGGAGNMTFTTTNSSSGGNLQTIILGAAGTYAGSTTITAGNVNNNMTVRAGVTDALPSTTVLTMDGGDGPTSTATRTITYELNGLNQTLAGLTNNTTRIQRNQRVNNASGTTATLTINNTGDFSYGSTVVDVFTTTAAITGNLNLVKNGSGTQTLTGAANTFTGTTTVQSGILSLGHLGSLTNSAFNTADSITGNSTNGLRTTVTTLTLGGLTGGNDFASRFTTTTGGYSGLTALTLNPGASVTHSYAGDIGDGATGMNLTKTGAGTQVLTATNTHTGTTSVNAGKLVVEGSIATSAVTVSGTGTILATDAVATVGNSLLIQAGAILAVGDAANAATATATVTNATTFNNNSIFSWDINAAGTSYDKLVTTDVLGEGAAGDAVFRIVAADATFANAYWDIDRTWTDIFTTDGSNAISGWASVFGSTVSVVNNSFTTITPVDGAFSLSGNTLTWTAVPEPSSALAGLLLASSLLRRRHA